MPSPNKINKTTPTPRTDAAPDPLSIARKAAVGFITHRDHNVSRQVDQLESFILGAIEQATAALRAENEKLRARAVLATRDILDTCDMGHDFLKLNGEATRCPKCLAQGNDKLLAELTALRRDKERLEALKKNGWSLKCFSVPTGADDFGIGWQITEQHMNEDEEKIIAEIHDDDPRKTLDAAMEGQP